MSESTGVPRSIFGDRRKSGDDTGLSCYGQKKVQLRRIRKLDQWNYGTDLRRIPTTASSPGFLREGTGFALLGSCDEERVRMAALRHRDQPTRRGGAALRLGFPVANGALHHGLYVLV